MIRRRPLILLACALTTADLLFLGWRWHRDTAPNAQVTYVGVNSIGSIVDAAQPALGLRAGQWYLGQRPLPDIAAYLRRPVGPEHIELVTAPTYGELVPLLRALKARKACNIMIRDGALKGPPGTLPEDRGKEWLDIRGLMLCGHGIGDAGFYGTLPPDGPIHVSPGDFVTLT